MRALEVDELWRAPTHSSFWNGFVLDSCCAARRSPAPTNQSGESSKRSRVNAYVSALSAFGRRPSRASSSVRRSTGRACGEPREAVLLATLGRRARRRAASTVDPVVVVPGPHVPVYDALGRAVGELASTRPVRREAPHVVFVVHEQCGVALRPASVRQSGGTMSPGVSQSALAKFAWPCAVRLVRAPVATSCDQIVLAVVPEEPASRWRCHRRSSALSREPFSARRSSRR